MTRDSALRDRDLAVLRSRIEQIQAPTGGRRGSRLEAGPVVQGRPAVTFGLEALDSQFTQGGLGFGTHQIVGAAAGVFAALLLARRSLDSAADQMLIVQERAAVAEDGGLYGPGLHALGLDPTRIGLVVARDGAQALRIVDEALKSSAVSAVVGEFRRGQGLIDLGMTQRFNISAQRAKSIAIIVTPDMTQTSAALTRWRAVPASSAAPGRWLGPPAFWLELVRNRLGRPGRWRVEWSYDDHVFRLAAPVSPSVVQSPADGPSGHPPPDPPQSIFAADQARRRDQSLDFGSHSFDIKGEERFAAAGG